MKSTFININMFIIYLFLSIHQVISVDFTYPSAIGLPNGNIFIVEKKGIYVYDERLLNVIHSYPFETNEEINDVNSLSNIIIKFQRNYIICLINLKIYFFDSEGIKLLETDKIITDEDFSYPLLTPIDLNEDNSYYYIIGYFLYKDNIYQIKLVYYKINLLNNENIYIDEIIKDKFTSSTWGNNRYFENKGLACEYMQHRGNQDKFLVCFFIFNKDDTFSLSHYFFDVQTNSITISSKYNHGYVDDLNDIKQIKAITNYNIKNALICLLFTNGNLNCYNFYYAKSFWNDGAFSEYITTNFNCRNQLYGMKLNYLVDMQTISLSCIDPVSTVQSIFLDNEFNVIHSYEQFNNCTSIFGHSILKLKTNSSSYVISDAICENVKMCFEPLEGSLSPVHIIDIITPTQSQAIEYSFEIKEEKEEEKEKEEEIEIEKEKSEEIEEEKENEIEEEKGIEEEMVEKEKTEIITHEFDCSNLEKCGKCDQDSFNNNLCISCNNEKNYFYLNDFSADPKNKYINCVNETTKPTNYYFNKDNLDFEPCYTTCASCKYGGNYKQNNCTSCDGIYYITNPEGENSFNCVIKCKYFYYIENNIYKCTEEPFCPEKYNYIINNKSKCTNDCFDDNDFKYRYNGECFKECPNNTKDDDDFMCKDIQNNKCHLSEKEVYFLNENTDFYEIEKIIIKYIKEFNYTDSHVSVYKNDEYTLTIYINNKCISELGLELPEIDFDSCYDKIIKNSTLNYNELIIAIIDKKIGSKNERKVIKYGLYSPLTGKYLNSEEICKDDKIVIKEDISNKILESGVDIDVIKDLIEDGVDVFNISSPFYNDICYQYNFNKDVPLKDRVFEFFPNISLCEQGCDFVGINMTTLNSECQCSFSRKEADLKDKVLDQAKIGFVEDIITSSNLYVIKCITLLVEPNVIKKCYGGFVISCLILIEIVCTLIYFKKNLYSINKYIFVITNKYINFLVQQRKNKNINNNNNNKNKNNPPKQKLINPKRKRSESQKFLRKNQSGQKTLINGNFNLIINHNNKNNNNNNDDTNQNDIYINNNEEKINQKNGSYIYKFPYHNNFPNSKDFLYMSKELNNAFINIKDDLDINIKEYIETQYDDMDYDEAIRKDHRKFCECFTEKVKDNHLIINTLFSDEYIKPRSIKILLLILQFNLYFFINGLFYDEEYISKIYHLDKDTFFTKAERFFDNLIYAALAGIIINYIIEFFFVEEIKIKKILKFEKDNIFVLKYEMIKILKSIKKRYLAFIIITFIISFIAQVHIFCFNVVYYHTMTEWIVFSLIIILSIQVGSILVYLLQTALRFISFRFKSEKLFKLSL